MNSALILHTFASRFFHIKVISGGYQLAGVAGVAGVK